MNELAKIITDLEYAAYNLCNGKKDTDLPPGIIESTGADDSLLIAIRDLKEIANRHEVLVIASEQQSVSANGAFAGLNKNNLVRW